MGIDPCLLISIWVLMLADELTFETHWSSRSTRVGDQAPAAKTTLSAKY
jgi:hypothetical protein